ncbi:MAG TPA: SdiA-regulated domain-containing protein [Methylophilaceae bacterium]|nr:SdiA-regulated domain-containing protein [Methylophilaceae bacterium]
MKKTFTAVLLIAVLTSLAYAFRLDALGWYLWHNSINSGASAFQLGAYEVEVDGKRIPGVSDASGLTFHEPSGTLFSVLNDEPTVIQLSRQGEVLRKIRIEGVSDMEGITHVTQNQFVVVEESKNRLILFEIGDADSINIADAPKLILGFENVRNKSFEGISWDAKNERILIVNEKEPKRLIEIRGLLKSPGSNGADITIRELWPDKPTLMSALRDLASLSYDEDTDHLLLLSEESKLIKEYDSQGEALSAMLLWKGFHGLSKSVPQAEGIAIGPDKKIYIISEPNLFYVFSPPRH